jgi:hypothetical protein
MAEGKGGALKWIGLGCGVFLLVAACGVGAAFFACQSLFEAPEGQARGFFADLRAGNYQDALRRTNAPYQSTHTVEAFQLAVSHIPVATQQTDVSFSSRDVNGDTATMIGDLDTPEGAVPVTVTLSRAGEHWYIDSVSVQGQLLQ